MLVHFWVDGRCYVTRGSDLDLSYGNHMEFLVGSQPLRTTHGYPWLTRVATHTVKLGALDLVGARRLRIVFEFDSFQLDVVGFVHAVILSKEGWRVRFLSCQAIDSSSVQITT